MHNLSDNEYSNLMLLVSEVRNYTNLTHDKNTNSNLEQIKNNSMWRLKQYTERILNDLKVNNNNLYKIITKN